MVSGNLFSLVRQDLLAFRDELLKKTLSSLKALIATITPPKCVRRGSAANAAPPDRGI